MTAEEKEIRSMNGAVKLGRFGEGKFLRFDFGHSAQMKMDRISMYCVL